MAEATGEATIEWYETFSSPIRHLLEAMVPTSEALPICSEPSVWHEPLPQSEFAAVNKDHLQNLCDKNKQKQKSPQLRG